MIEEQSEVFRDELGLMTKYKAKLAVKPGAKPIFVRPCSVPFALREPVERELERLEAARVIEKVNHSDWAASNVAVPRGDMHLWRLQGNCKSVLRCGGLSLVKIRRPDVEPTRGRKFTKLDLSSAYQQMALTDESKKFLTINTHRGLYQYTRLPFGVASSPAFFQKAIDEILQGLPNVICCLDDILVTGASNQEHLKNLKVVLIQ